MTALVAKADISGTPSRATANAGFGNLWEFVDERFATGDGTAAEKSATRAALETARGLQPITASVGSNALTITLNPTNLEFRSATLTSGTVNMRTVAAAISVVVSSGSTLGTTSGAQSTLAVIAIDNAGTVELAVVNLTGAVNLDETGLISTTAEGGAGAADSATVIYSTTARSNVPYRVVGYVTSTQATAGTWATAPSLIQGSGGLAQEIPASKIANALNASGSAPLYACRAWVNFNGTGTVAIRASGNVTSTTDVGAGTYTINFTTAMQDANYCANITVGNTVVGTHGGEIKSDGVSASALNIFTYGGGSVADFPVVCVSVFR